MQAEKEPGLRFVPLKAKAKKWYVPSWIHQSIERAINSNMEKHDANRLNPFPLLLQPLK